MKMAKKLEIPDLPCLTPEQKKGFRAKAYWGSRARKRRK